jgi:hypothetical protein
MVRSVLIQAARYAFLGCCLILFGCKYTTLKDYAYQSPDIQFSWGDLRVKLSGTAQNTDAETIVQGTPYRLLILMNTDTKSGCEVHLESVKLVDALNHNIPFSAADKMTRFNSKYEGRYHAFFAFDDMDLIYDDYFLDIKFSINGDVGCHEQEALKIPLKKDYKETKIGIWNLPPRRNSDGNPGTRT